jgi:rhodanese-related sulfurtransferase
MSIAALVKQGAEIIDVRSPMEYAGGHVEGSINIPLQNIPEYLTNRTATHPIVFCCASGGRSGQATAYAKEQGVDAYNGGAWIDVHYELNERNN